MVDVLDLARRILSADVLERTMAADEATDVMRGLGGAAPALSSVLALAARYETDERARESQLHALVEMDVWSLVSADIVPLISALEGPPPDAEQLDYLAELLGEGDDG